MRSTWDMKPVVYLIGAGPGDPDLMTLRGAKALQRSQVVLYDGLSNTQILEMAPQAEHICVGKHGQSRIWTQPEIIAEMLRHARAGKIVARLKGGDPAVFARTAEEVDACHDAGIQFEIVPGITAALAAGSYAGIPVTHRKLASAVALVTGHEEPGKSESALDWDALARFPGTLVIYMGVTTAEQWTGALIAAGKDPATPTALVRRCSLPDQTSLHCRLDEVAQRLTPPANFRPPVIAIIGPVTTLADTMDWVSKRPLHGRNILVTRPRNQTPSMVETIKLLGGNPIIAPAIEIQPLDEFSRLDQAIEHLPGTDFIVFCSTNGVDHFLGRMETLGHDVRRLAGIEVAVVGSATAKRLQQYRIAPDIVPTDFRAASLVECLGDRVADKRVLIVRASRGSDELPTDLIKAGANVQEVVAYNHVDVDTVDETVLNQLNRGEIDWVTVTSSAIAVNLCRLYGDALGQTRLAAISSVTADVLRKAGLKVDVVADPHTTESLMNAIAEQT